jgi:hypothetical protein
MAFGPAALPCGYGLLLLPACMQASAPHLQHNPCCASGPCARQARRAAHGSSLILAGGGLGWG